MRRNELFGVLAAVFAALLTGNLGQANQPAVTDNARQILKTTGIKGGLIVHLGSGDGKLTAALHAGDSYLVHGLDADADNVETARKHIRASGLYGKVSVERLSGNRLPYAENLVNLIVSEAPGRIPMDEVLRVLAPDGVAYINKDGKWIKTIKSRPDEMDEWTHFLHGADGNAVANDTIVGPPRHMQWVGDIKWARAHEQLASTSAIVSAAGRVFYIVDEGSTASIDLPASWSLVARDAFNGVILWKRPVGSWETHLRGFRFGPPQLPRRLGAVADRGYVTLGYGKPLVSLDAASGELIRTSAGTDGTEEIVCSGGVLLLVLGNAVAEEVSEFNKRRGQPTPPDTKSILAVDAQSGAVLWKKSLAPPEQLAPLSLAASGARAFFQSGERVVCIDLKTGKRHWRSSQIAKAYDRYDWFAPTLVVYGNVVLFADGQTLVGLSAETGETLWTDKSQLGYHSPVDLLVADGLLWTGKATFAREPGFTAARDPATGEVKTTRPVDQEFFTAGMSHHRCYRNKATDRYLLLGRAGVELIDVNTGRAMANHWIRGTCQYGIMPCNGLLYTPPHSCACYIQAKLSGFNALAPKRPARLAKPQARDGRRFERGPAYSQIPNPKSQIRNPADWPTYRHDRNRSGATQSTVAAAVKPTWQTELGGRLTSPVIAAGKVYVASVDTHTVHALDAADGKPLWSYTADGRVDSPPTIYKGLALFGSADGWVYCLRGSDGALVWRFRAAPEDRRVVAYGQLESAWPVHGSVLVDDGAVFFAAGRSSFLDGGICLYRLDPSTGKLLSEKRVCTRDPKTGEQPRDAVRGFNMTGALPDVLSGDGTSIFMRHVRFDRQCIEQQEPKRHLFTPTGFLDDSWWHRSYWIFGTKFIAGWPGWWRVGNQIPSGRLLVLDDSTIYGFGRDRYPGGNTGQWRGGEQYRLFAAGKDDSAFKPRRRKRGQKPDYRSSIKYRWCESVPMLARAMVLADKTLFVAGVAKDNLPDNLVSLKGKNSLLWAVSAADGEKLAELKLDSLPVFDALAAGGGRLFLTTTDGKVRCFGE